MKFTLFVPVVLIALLSFTTYRYPVIFASIQRDDSAKYQVKFLDLSQRDLTSLPADLHKYRSLEELDLSNNPIRFLDSSILSLRHLRKLKINQCHYLNAIATAEIINKTRIERLEWNRSTLVNIPSALFSNKTLKHLSLRENYITYFPPEIALGARLQTLDLAYNLVDTLPHELRAMKWLQHLDLSYNPCLQQSVSCERIGELENIHSLKLDSIRYLPGNFSQLTELHTLSIANSVVTALPADIKSLEKLELFKCNNLQYASLFSDLGKSGSLKELTISSTQLKMLPENISDLKSLKRLTILDNQLSSLPLSFNRLTELTVLSIRLTDHPEKINQLFSEIGSLKSLDTLDLSHSSLSSLPASVSSLKNISVLNLEGVPLKALPTAFTILKNLNELNVRGTELNTAQLNELEQKLPSCNILYDQPYAVPAAVKQDFLSQREEFTLVAEKAATVTTADGSVIKVPSNAFVYADGKKVKGEVSLSFQAFYSPAQIYLSGINMNYDSAGVRNSFISAGMLDIRARAQGRTVQLAPQKKILVDFKSTNSSRNFNIYRYDSVAQNWTYKATDTSVSAQSIADQGAKVKLKTSPEVKMRSPNMRVRRVNRWRQGTTGIYYTVLEKRNRKKYTFWIERGYHSGGEVTDSSGKKIKLEDEIPLYVNNRSEWVYEPDSAGPDFFDLHNKQVRKMFVDKGSYKLRNGTIIKYLNTPANAYVDITVVPDKENDRFSIRFRVLNDSIDLNSYPEYRSPSASVIQQTTRKKYLAYVEQRKKREADEAAQGYVYKQDLRSFDFSMEEYRENLRKMNAKELASLQNLQVNEDRIIRSLALDGLGQWNCDIINRMENGQEILARLYVEGKQMNPVSITVIDQTNNGFGSFKSSMILIDRYVNHVLLARFRDGSLAYTKFTITKPGLKKVDLAMNVLNSKELTMAEFSRKVFN